jgi:hypothetical protein
VAGDFRREQCRLQVRRMGRQDRLLNELSTRLSVRVPRRCRSSCSRLDRNSTVWSPTGDAAVYVSLVRTRDLYEVDLGRTTFIPGFRVFMLHRNTFGASPTRRYPGHGPLRGRLIVSAWFQSLKIMSTMVVLLNVAGC